MENKKTMQLDRSNLTKEEIQEIVLDLYHRACAEKDLQMSVDLLTVALEIRDNALCCTYRALCKSRMGDYEGALIDYTRVINEFEGKEFAYFERAWFFIEHKEYRKALRDINKAIRESEYFKYLYCRHICYLNLEMYEDSVKDITRVIELTDYDSSFLNSRAIVYKHMSLHLKYYDHKDELEELAKADELMAEDMDYRLLLKNKLMHNFITLSFI